MNIKKFFKRLFRRHNKRRTVNGVYVGRVCEICGAVLKGGTKTQHMKEAHPDKIAVQIIKKGEDND